VTRYMVIWHGITTDGATSRRIVKQYFLNADSEAGAVRKARDIMRNSGVYPDGVPECRRAEPGDETMPAFQGPHAPTREGFDPEAHSTFYGEGQ
jgi:hypothetical protein